MNNSQKYVDSKLKKDGSLSNNTS